MADFGVLGLGVMGASLAENIEEHGSKVAVWNRKPEITEAFLARTAGRRFTATRTLVEFVQALEQPRRILIMIKAGPPVDQVLDQLEPLLSAGDIVIDGGNTWFPDTIRRERKLARSGIHLVGMGVSGGEEGARHGPSLMPGGSKQAFSALRPVLEQIAAQTPSGPCVTHLGPDGAGHFVKMVHNGIEYGNMQLIAEVYDLLARGLHLPTDAIAEQFAAWNQGPLASYLVELTATVLKKRAPDGSPLVESVLDQAEQKGTGRWTVKVALDLGVAIPTIAAAVDARILSSMKPERVKASTRLRGPTRQKLAGDRDKLIEAARAALLLGQICSFAQGLALIKAGSSDYRWDIDLKEVARIWKGGCIIRSALLDSIMTAFGGKRPPVNLLMHREFVKLTRTTHRGLRRMAAGAQSMGIPAPALCASLAYYDGYRTAELPQNLTQAQRDAFGAHTYLRKDDPQGPPIHTDWMDASA